MSSANGSGPAATPGAAEYALLAAVSLTWGSSYMFTKVAVSAIPPLTLIVLRTGIAALFMSAILAFSGRMTRLSWRDIGILALIGLTVNAATLCLIAISVSFVDSSVTATTMALVPLITAVLAVFRGDYPTSRNILGIAVGLAGIVVLFGPQALMGLGDSAMGAAAAISASIIFASSLFVSGLARRHHPLLVATASLVSAALWTLPVALVSDGLPSAIPGSQVIGAVVVLALLNTAVASLLVFALVGRTGPAFTALNNYLVPAVAVACGSVFLGEAFTVQKAAGVALVLAGVAISSMRRKPGVVAPAPST
jgi:drug/metabolite transporter (DMT)-like permease